jgi:uncharacterized protein (TIGR02145 family)
MTTHIDLRIPFFFLLVTLLSCQNSEQDQIVDQNGRVYKTVELNNQIWLAENLNDAQLGICYEYRTLNCKIHGRLYTIEGAIQGCERLGPGWRVPSSSDWEGMILSLNGGFFDYEISTESVEVIGDPYSSYATLAQKKLPGLNLKHSGIAVLDADGLLDFYFKNRMGLFWSLDSIQIPESLKPIVASPFFYGIAQPPFPYWISNNPKGPFFLC